MKKRILVLCLCVIMATIALVFGTMAYFTDTAVAHSSAIEVGDVDIDWISINWAGAQNQQPNIWDRPADSKSPFENPTDLKIMPGISHTAALSLKNSGSNAAYLRIRVAVKRGEALISEKEVFNVDFDSIVLKKGDTAQSLGADDFTVTKELGDAASECVYYTVTLKNPVAGDTDITMNSVVGLNASLNNSEITTVFGAEGVELTFVAEAIQTTTFTNAADAFTAFEAARQSETTTTTEANN